MNNYAIVEFGSRCRNISPDIYSDRDLLVVCEDGETRRELRSYYRNQGYSISSFTLIQLEYMKDKGSLFLQHIKMEGRVLIDQCGFLEFLDSCDFIPPSTEELARCKASIDFVGTWPQRPELTLWKADFLYSVSRDFIIKKLASMGTLVWGLEDIAYHLLIQFGFSNVEFQKIIILRKGKAAYRTDIDIPEDVEAAVDEWAKTLQKYFGESIYNIDRSLNCDFSFLRVHNFNTPYERLRSVEAIYLTLVLNNIKHQDHELLGKIIINPNLYSSSQKKNSNEIHKYLIEVLDLLEASNIKMGDLPVRASIFR